MAQKNAPDFSEEALLWNQGSAFVFGVDEAGRGCLAGPVCAGVSLWAPHTELSALPFKVNDSKQMSEAQRESAFAPIMEHSLAWGVGFASAAEIDEWNILRGTHLAAARALERGLAYLVNKGLVQIGGLAQHRFILLSDGRDPLLSPARHFVVSPEFSPEFPLLCELFQMGFEEKTYIKGDSRIFSIAAASVLAKVSRDRHMHELDKSYPGYDFALHKGYSTAKHVQKLMAMGPCSEHRQSFSPVKEAAKNPEL